MSYHRFKIDQIVVPVTTGLPFGLYTILRLLPLVNGEPRYRIKGARDGLERAVFQGEIRLPKRSDTGFGPRSGAGTGGNDTNHGQTLPARFG